MYERDFIIEILAIFGSNVPVQVKIVAWTRKSLKTFFFNGLASFLH